MLSNILDKISFYALFVIMVLLPIFFLPFTQIPVEISKGLLLVLGMAVVIIFWIAARFSDGKISIPKSPLILSVLGILLIILVSGLFSGAASVSLFGTMLDVGTFYFMLATFLLMVFASILFQDMRNARQVFWWVIIASAVLFLFQTLRLIFPEMLSLGLLGDKTDNVMGAWNSLGLFAGLSVIMSLFAAEFFPLSKIQKWFLGIVILLSVFMAAVVNFPLIWKLLGVFALIIFVYKVSLSLNKGMVEGAEARKKSFPFFALAVVMVSLWFFISGQYFGGILPDQFGVSYVEISPSMQATFEVGSQAFLADPVIGVGPNNFSKTWAMFKPESINVTQFWNTSFSSGSSLLLTFMSNTGALGILSWLLFFVLFVIAGVRSLFTSIKNNRNWENIAFFVAALYLFVAALFYSVGTVTLVMAFAFTGIFLGLTMSKTPENYMTFSFLDDPRKSFFSILGLVVLMMITAAAGFKYAEKLASASYFRSALAAETIEEAETAITNALVLYQNDLYLRTYSQVYLTKISNIISSNSESQLSEEQQAELQASFDQAVNGAQLAVNYDSKNYLNYNSLGNVYSSVASLGVEGAYEQAIEAYKMSAELNPKNPGIKLALASASLSNDNIEDARMYGEEALTLKSNYIDALLVLAQIERADGKTSKAVEYGERALTFDPTNKELIDYVASLRRGGSVPAPASTTATNETDEELEQIEQ